MDSKTLLWYNMSLMGIKITDKREIKKTLYRFTSAFKDLVIIGFITIFVFILSYFFNIFIFLVEIYQKHPRAITYLDEIITVLLTLAIGFAVFSWRRWMELKKETAERIRLQEELTKMAETKAETESIINRQLHVEIESRKEAEAKLMTLTGKNKLKAV
jgi:glucan phosphoethanolaminetransferase (alkaline phosphatase superfamily)